MRIVFLGTPEFAVESLNALLQSNHKVVAVVTAPDALGGRGRNQIIQSAVKKFALLKNLMVLQPEKLRDQSFINTLRDLKADIQVVVAFRMLPEQVWNMPPLGTINVHGSLLPKYRGAAPIHWAVIKGEKVTGVTIFRLKHKIDTGDVITSAQLPIGVDETTGEVYQKLMKVGASTLIKALDQIESGTVIYESQNENEASPAPKLYHENAEISNQNSSLEIHNLVRGLNPNPSAWIKLNNLKYFIHKTTLPEPIVEFADFSIGQLFVLHKELYLRTKDGALKMIEIQPEGKKRMAGEEYARGLR